MTNFKITRLEHLVTGHGSVEGVETVKVWALFQTIPRQQEEIDSGGVHADFEFEANQWYSASEDAQEESVELAAIQYVARENFETTQKTTTAKSDFEDVFGSAR